MLTSIKLNDGTLIPSVAYGLGTANAWEDTSEHTLNALRSGHTHLDMAWHYGNAETTGEGIRRYLKESGKSRDDIFITCKGGSIEDDPAQHKGMRFYLTEVLKQLGLGSVDLYLIHGSTVVPNVKQAWEEMESIKKDRLARSIGVSNFDAPSLREVLEVATIKPSVNQIEFHPYSYSLYEPDLLPLCTEHGITISAYASLLPIVRRPGHAVDPVVSSIVSERKEAAATAGDSTSANDMTDGQVLLDWARQMSRGVVVTQHDYQARTYDRAADALRNIDQRKQEEIVHTGNGVTSGHTGCRDPEMVNAPRAPSIGHASKAWHATLICVLCHQMDVTGALVVPV